MSKGVYPSGTSLPVSDLIVTLASEGSFSQQPKNPFTGKPFAATDPSGKVEYTLDSSTQSYALTAYGQGNKDVLFVLQNN